MGCYTVCNCLIENAKIETKYLTDVLFVFTQQTNTHKVALDSANRILAIYERIASENSHIATWLDLMTKVPSPFERVKIDVPESVSEDELFLLVCSSTNEQRKILVYSHQRWNDCEYVEKNLMKYKEVSMNVYDRDEAIEELKEKSVSITNISDSIIAQENSQISEVKKFNK